ncbi:MAG: M20 family metallopeptidase [Lachnospiraceae bacterium]|nr:M20 family metallopeptidase [Lachnospiraceae bacterium]
MDYLKRAEELYEETVAYRRYLHQNPEISMELPKTSAFIRKKLTEMGYTPQCCGGDGIVATVGRAGRKTILLRSEMDALPMREESGLPFASTCDAAHTCGHDCNAAQLLTAARLLKENEAALAGMVKLMFQPAEETFLGARAMIADGVLENPRPDAALSFHVTSGQMSPAVFIYNATGVMMNSVDGFRIKIKGKGSHGAYPERSVDPVNIAVHIYLALEAIVARELTSTQASVMTVGILRAGDAYNIIPETAELQGSIRSESPEQRELLVRRMKEAARGVAETYNGSAEVEMIAEVPPLICNPQVTQKFVGYMKELEVPGQAEAAGIRAAASDDFACVLERIPGAYIYLSAGFPDRPATQQHSPDVLFNEEVFRFGPAYLAHCATRWLEEEEKGRK